jgi:AcrR family transcriptional regulator
MGPRERRLRERQETRDRILDAARDMFAAEGVEAVTMREIAKRIEYTPTAIYHHFQDKDALIQEICRRDFLALAQVFLKIGRTDDPVERLQRTGLAYVEFALEHPSHYRFMFMTTRPESALEGIDRGNPAEDAYAFLRNTIAEGIAAGRFRPEFKDPEQLAQIMWAAMHGVVSLHIAKGNDPSIEWRDPRQTARVMCDALIRGVLREGKGR